MKRSPRGITQGAMRNGIDVGPKMSQVSPVLYWYKAHFFKNEDEARGAFRLAYQQGLDGMGNSIEEWMGLSEQEYTAWMDSESLPKLGKRR
jgi:histidyl-tRNA synthetase